MDAAGTGYNRLMAGMMVMVHVNMLAANPFAARSSSGGDGDCLGGQHDVLDRLDNDNLADSVAVGNVVGADE